LLGQVDAVSIVVPTRLHFEVARDFLATGAHVLVEKPVTVTVDEADELIRLAKANNLRLMVGHLERFNAALLGLDLTQDKPLFIESHRLAPFNPRANDVSVVLDLMIHDIDIILDIVDSEVERIDAKGVTVLTSDTDIANARITFKSGCVANVTAAPASRLSARCGCSCPIAMFPWISRTGCWPSTARASGKCSRASRRLSARNRCSRTATR
jgi:predicted dehydrogenase